MAGPNLQSALLRLAQTALEQSRGTSAAPPEPARRGRRGMSTGRAILLGAGLATAGQALVRARGPAVVDAVRLRLSEQIAPSDAEVVADEDFDEDEEDFDEREGEREAA